MKILRVLAIAGLAFASSVVAAEGYPALPIRVIVPQEPGGTVDSVMRFIANRLEASIGSPVVVENRSGAGGAMGAEYVARATSDGYTLLAASTNTQAMTPNVLRSLRYDPIGDFVPVVNMADATTVVIVSPMLPVNSLAELAAYSKAYPGTLNYGSAGLGSSNHLMAEQWKSLSGADLTHIPYRGVAQAVQALLAGDVSMLALTTATAAPYVQSGKAKALAVSGGRRLAMFPGVPTTAEAGFPVFDVRLWVGLMAPVGTPTEVVAYLNREVNRVLRHAEVSQWLAEHLHQRVGGTPADFAATLRADHARWASVVASAGIAQQ
jgi:tripartite-type tricarboxylate transporter receptor subunit TctC